MAGSEVILSWLPDGAALIRPTSGVTVGRYAFTPPSGKMMLFLWLFLIFLPLPPTPSGGYRRFDNWLPAGKKSAVYCRSTALSAVSEPEFAGIQCARGGQYAPSGLQHGGRR